MNTSYRKVDVFIDRLQTKVLNGEHVNLSQLHRDVGYSEHSARAQKAIKTDTYKERMQPFIEQLKNERDRILEAMSNKDLDEERFRDLNTALKDITKNVQLLGGKATENVQFQITEGANTDRIDGNTEKIHDVEPSEGNLEEETTTDTSTTDKDA